MTNLGAVPYTFFSASLPMTCGVVGGTLSNQVAGAYSHHPHGPLSKLLCECAWKGGRGSGWHALIVQASEQAANQHSTSACTFESLKACCALVG